MSAWNGLKRGLSAALVAVALAACGGGGSDAPAAAAPAPVAPAAPAPIDIGDDSATARILSAQPTSPASPAAAAPAAPTDTALTLTVHYKRAAGDYTGWQLHHWGAAADVNWNEGRNADGSDAFGVFYNVPLKAGTAVGNSVGYLLHKGDAKDHGGADQGWVLKAGKNEIWRIEGDPTSYTALPGSTAAPDIRTVRVHYKRFGGDYAAWGLHLWPANGIDVARLPAGTAIDVWTAAVPFSGMPGYSAGAGEIVFDIPVLNPKDDASRKALEFIIHGQAPNEANKDGRDNNIRVDYAGLTIRNQVGEIWLVQGDATVYPSAPDTRSVSTTDAKAYWLNRQLLQWPLVDGGGVFKLYHSTTGQITAAKDAKVAGADGAITLDRFTAAVPAALATRFKFIGAGVALSVRDADLAQMGTLHKKQLLLVQEDAAGNVQNATSAQTPGALDDLYAAAANVNDLGVTVAAASTTFKLWAPTAQRVFVSTLTMDGVNETKVADEMAFDAATGVWSVTKPRDMSGATYRYAVDVFVRGDGVVRNFVTDPYSVSLSTNSLRSTIASLDAPALKPAGWDAAPASAKVAAQTDMAIYELHVRDFSINDMSVSAANRGKYGAFTEAGSNGMKHLKALADAGLTDVHLLPVFDLASVPEFGCTTPAVSGSADSEAQQAAVAATAGSDCFNWGYDPFHFNAPEGSYASTAADGAKRIVEFRQMVLGLKNAGLRVGMDVVYNHTTASGQNAKSVLDRIVPGYYHRLNSSGRVEMSTCCDNTATEHLMMGKLMSDSVLLWARDYKIDSFRFDIMGHQPRAVMEAMQTRVQTALGRKVQFIGEGWNFGEVQDGARFVQATLYSLNGSGIGSFNPIIRDAVRGGGCCDSGTALVSSQGFISGLFYDPNALGGGRTKNDLMWLGDQLKASLAGSLRSFQFTTHWDELRTAESLGNSIGWSTQPDEVVNYVENHDNLTLFDSLALRLPTTTSREDRARVQLLGNALNAFSQGVVYFHAGTEVLRSKSLDRNSYDAGDWFNRLDWTYQDNYFGTGLPRQSDNGANWTLIKPFLANPLIKPAPADIAWTRDAFRDLLRLRASSTLLRMRTADDIKARLKFLNTGSTQNPVVLAAAIDGNGYPGAGFKRLVYLVNVSPSAQTITAPTEAGLPLELHPVHAAPAAADKRAAAATFNTASGSFTVPGRTAVVFVQK